MTVARKGYEHANFSNKCLSTDARHDAYETSMSNSTKKGLVALRNFRDFDSVSLGLQHLFESHLSKVIWCAFFDVFVLSYCYCRELLRNSAKQWGQQVQYVENVCKCPGVLCHLHGHFAMGIPNCLQMSKFCDFLFLLLWRMTTANLEVQSLAHESCKNRAFRTKMFSFNHHLTHKASACC